LLKAQNIDVILDDTEERPGSKFATHDLIGSPWQIIIGTKKAAQNLVELKNRRTGEPDGESREFLIRSTVSWDFSISRLREPTILTILSNSLDWATFSISTVSNGAGNL
jgi:histidyl-tRNA synthetase